ncbi:uncharacterized protein LOC119405760 [Rhipicephalus sanguineus]|uniref:uncharacterized protein LOC119405760 n=1 Tax=Rhipicephalus sanguineus TaxID=34632 RepID=UPI0018958AB4|nr:uncharacterized protein LOC119405760 [Rhipicephalus sanguineus]
MLNSVYTQCEDVEALLDSRGSSMMEVSKTAIKELIDFLAPFKEATDMLEKDKQPTLPLVLLCKTKLEKHLTSVPAEAPTTAALKLRAREFLQGKLELSELDNTATFFWPPFRRLRALEEDERSAVYASVKTRMLAIPTNSLPSDACAGETCSKKPAKRRLIDDFEEWHDVTEPQKRRDGLTSYLNSTEVCEDVGDLLERWKSKKDEFPRLSQLARQILCVPARSASSQRNFSAAGFVMNERRTCLNKSKLLVYQPIRMGRRPQGWVPTAEIDIHLFTKNGVVIPRKGTVRVLGMLISENGRNAATIHKLKQHTAATVRLIQRISGRR